MMDDVSEHIITRLDARIREHCGNARVTIDTCALPSKIASQAGGSLEVKQFFKAWLMNFGGKPFDPN